MSTGIAIRKWLGVSCLECGASGTEPPLVFLHGLFGSAEDWRGVLAQFPQRRRCLALTLPGHGGEGASDPLPHDWAGLQRWLRNLLAAAEVGPDAILVGYSMGGRIALDAVTNGAVSLGGLVLESASPGLQDTAERVNRCKRDMELAGRVEQCDLADLMREWYEQPVFASLRARPRLLEETVARRSRQDAEAVAEMLRRFSVGRQEPTWDLLPGLDLPVLVITGAEDRKYAEIGRRTVAALPRGRHVELADAGHNVHLEKPDDFVRAVREWLIRRAGAGSDETRP